MGLNLIKATKKNNLFVYYKKNEISTIQIPRETDLKIFLNQKGYEKKYFVEEESVTKCLSIDSFSDSIYISIDNISEFDGVASDENYDELINEDEDIYIDRITYSHRQRLNSNENYVTIVQTLGDTMNGESNTKSLSHNYQSRINEIILNKDIILNVMNANKECTIFWTISNI